jgi:hypothetical protein
MAEVTDIAFGSEPRLEYALITNKPPKVIVALIVELVQTETLKLMPIGLAHRFPDVERTVEQLQSFVTQVHAATLCVDDPPEDDEDGEDGEDGEE